MVIKIPWSFFLLHFHNIRDHLLDNSNPLLSYYIPTNTWERKGITKVIDTSGDDRKETTTVPYQEPKPGSKPSSMPRPEPVQSSNSAHKPFRSQRQQCLKIARKSTGSNKDHPTSDLKPKEEPPAASARPHPMPH